MSTLTNSIVGQLLSLLTKDEIVVPKKYTEQVVAVKDLLASDSSGLVNSILDYGINAANVPIKIETSNSNLTTFLNKWLNDLNIELLGEVPSGINGLLKEYLRERWKGSSFLILRTVWEDVGGWKIPTKLWFVDGASIEVTNNSASKAIGNKTYKLKTGKGNPISLPSLEGEKIFVQRPYSSWTEDYTTPYLIQRGLYRNVKFLELLASKGELVVGKAIEYLFLFLKGNADLAKLGNENFTYSKEELIELKKNLEQMIQERNLPGQGTPTYLSNFDTVVQHLIPEYEKILKPELYASVEKRILAGLGIADIVQGFSSRKESVLNPAPFQAEVKGALNDFCVLFSDLIKMILKENSNRKKYTATDYIQLQKGQIVAFYDSHFRDFLRSLWDRGQISSRTLVEYGIEADFDAEMQYRKTEAKTSDPIMTPHPVQYQDLISTEETPSNPNEETTPDKTGPEKKNFKNSSKKNN